MIIKWLKQRFVCKHKWELLFDIGGDMQIYFGARSCWKCFKCDAVKWEQFRSDEHVYHDD